MTTRQSYQQNTDFISEKFDNEILVYSVTDSKGVYLNETAYLVWEMCGKKQSIDDIITTLIEAYPDQEASIRDDVIAAVDSLVENKVLLAPVD